MSNVYQIIFLKERMNIKNLLSWQSFFKIIKQNNNYLIKIKNLKKLKPYD